MLDIVQYVKYILYDRYHMSYTYSCLQMTQVYT
jgi:hypothetical protein